MNRLTFALFALAAVAFAQHEHQHHKHVSCVQCTSEDNSECAETGAAVSAFTKVCPKLESGALAGTEAIGCRKILQKVNDEKNVVRQCAYSGENADGTRKTGNSGITLFYYQCNSAPDATGLPCNGVSGFSILASSLIAIVARIIM